MAATSPYFDDLETRDPEEREATLIRDLRKQLVHAKDKAPYYRSCLAEIDPDEVTDRSALARLPVTRKHDLIELQRRHPPFGGLNPIPPEQYAHVYCSPGPIFEPATRRTDYWGCARAFYAAGFRAGHVVHNSLSYHLTPGGWILDDGARAVGATVIPGGVGNTEQQVEAIARYRPHGYAGTPDFLKTLLDRAADLGLDASSITRALVSAGPLFPSLRQEYRERGIDVLQCYATADLGSIAYETEAMEGMIVTETYIVEIVRPGTGDLVPEGEVGEVVVTTLNPDYPLIRFGTGDLSAVLPGPSPCGRTNMRIKGWMGRADQTTKVRGMFVHPEQVAEVARRHPEISKARLVVDADGGRDVATLHCEVENGNEALVAIVEKTFHSVCKVRGIVKIEAPGSLPNDGKVIDDVRRFD